MRPTHTRLIREQTKTVPVIISTPVSVPTCHDVRLVKENGMRIDSDSDPRAWVWPGPWVRGDRPRRNRRSPKPPRPPGPGGSGNCDGSKPKTQTSKIRGWLEGLARPGRSARVTVGPSLSMPAAGADGDVVRTSKLESPRPGGACRRPGGARPAPVAAAAASRGSRPALESDLQRGRRAATGGSAKK